MIKGQISTEKSHEDYEETTYPRRCLTPWLVGMTMLSFSSFLTCLENLMEISFEVVPLLLELLKIYALGP